MSEDKKDVFDPQGKEVVIGDTLFRVKPFVIKDRSSIVKLICKIIDQFSGDENAVKGINLGTVINKAMDNCHDDLMDIYCKVLGKDKEWIENNITIGHEVELVTAIMEVNSIPLLISQASKIRAKSQ